MSSPDVTTVGEMRAKGIEAAEPKAGLRAPPVRAWQTQQVTAFLRPGEPCAFFRGVEFYYYYYYYYYYNHFHYYNYHVFYKYFWAHGPIEGLIGT